MEVLQNKTDQELLQSMLAETAKALNEVNCARKDLDKARNRLTFQIAVINEMINREED
jgi:septal ring factor EnvC (AmiA/AmiB activator)